jgi:dGTPase
MKIDYASILKTNRLRAENVTASGLSVESETDRSRIIFSPAFRRLQQQAQLFSLDDNAAARSRLSHALQVAQVGRAIAGQVAAGLAAQGWADGETYAALLNFVETACLMRDIGTPPFGRAGQAALQNWFTAHGPAHVRAASGAFGAKELDGKDPRVVNALIDFYQFNEVAQGLRVLSKLHWHGESGGLNLTKTTLAAYLRHLGMSGGDSIVADGKFSDQVGFFSTEAGLIKSIWSCFGYSAGAPQRFPLTYIVEAANDIVAGFGDLEDAIATGVVDAHAAIRLIRDNWLSTYIPMDPDASDETIMEILGHAVDAGEGKSPFFAAARAALFTAMGDYAARSYLGLHEEVMAGRLDTLLLDTSGTGVLLATVKDYCQSEIHGLQQVQRHALNGYNVVYALMQQFAVLLKAPALSFQHALNGNPTAEHALFLERQLVALIPAECRLAYTHLVAQLGQARGRDEEFEEWNARAHLLVDFISGMGETAAVSTFRRLAGIEL